MNNKDIEIHGLNRNNKLYHVWSDIKQRCYNNKRWAYKWYGARGITMSVVWKNSFICFYDWCINNGYIEGLEIDRKDVNGNYEPSNCQFISHTDNCAVGKRRKYTSNKSGHVGICFDKRYEKYLSYITINKKQIFLGRFNTKEEALQARINAEILHFGKQKTNL